MNSNSHNHNNPIVIGEIIESDANKGLTVRLDDGRIGEVDLDQISDVDIGPIASYFSHFPKYKFKVIKNQSNDADKLKLSYKLCHPKLIKNNKKIIPTCNHFNTLKKMIWFEIYLYDKQHQMDDVTTKKLNMNLDDIQIIKKEE